MFVSRAKPMCIGLVLFGLMIAPVLAQDDKEDEDKKKDSSIEVEMVVSASRKAEKKLEAPSTIETIPEATLVEAAATTYSAAAAQIKGVDYVNGGITLQRVNARGFATSYQSRMLSMVDGRLATLPGAGIPQGTLTPTASLDVKTVEVVLGPASALYGANASAGVFNVITKSPWDEEGTSVSLKAGEQSLINAQLRHAGISSDGRWAWKITGEVLSADDFDNENVYFADGTNQTTHTQAEIDEALRREGDPSTWAWREDEIADFDVTSNKYEANVYYRSGDYQARAAYGWSTNDGFGTTNLGRNRLEGWEVETLEVEVSHPRWYLRGTQTKNDAGGTFGAQNVTPALAAGLPYETIISDPNIALIFDASEMSDIEFQANQTWGNFELVGGASYREFKPDSGGTYLDDGGEFPWQTGITRDETGVYIQGDLRLLEEKLRLTGAYRYDDSNEYDAQRSPKFSVTYTEGNHNFRAGYNEAHRSPSILENHLYFARVAALGNINVALGNPVGWTVTDLATGEQTVFPGLTPEFVKTTEVGYRGIFGGSVVVDAVYWDSQYENFISALQTIAFVSLGTVATRNDGNYENWPYVLTYLNYGQADVSGFDIGVDYYYEDIFSMRLSYGHSELDSFENDTAIPDLPYNTPEDKYKGTFTLSNMIVDNTFFSMSGRHTEEYPYISGRWVGDIGPSTIFDFSAGYRWDPQDMLFKLSVANIFDEDETELLGVPVVPRFITFEIQKRF